MQAQMTSSSLTARRRLRSQNPTWPLPKALRRMMKRLCKAHLLALPLLALGPILLAPVVDGDLDALFMATPAFVGWIQMLLAPIYEHYGYLVSLQAAILATSLVAWSALRFLFAGGIHWSVHGFFWLVAGFSAASALAVFTLFGLIGLLIAAALVLWLVGIAVTFSGLLILVGLFSFAAFIVLIGAVVNAGVNASRRHNGDEHYEV